MFCSGLDAVRTALEMEKQGYDALLSVHKLADTHKDHDVSPNVLGVLNLYANSSPPPPSSWPTFWRGRSCLKWWQPSRNWVTISAT